ncbi:MAG: hypothetical protein F6K10_25105 [Moorea sp. SIO2B7]|nr:hypothetical protein [Moorena sp. SIO2B7]
MKVLLCSDSATLAVNLLASQLSDHEIITCPSDTIIKYLDSVDIVIPWMANIDASIIASGHFGLVQEFSVAWVSKQRMTYICMPIYGVQFMRKNGN